MCGSGKGSKFDGEDEGGAGPLKSTRTSSTPRASPLICSLKPTIPLISNNAFRSKSAGGVDASGASSRIPVKEKKKLKSSGDFSDDERDDDDLERNLIFGSDLPISQKSGATKTMKPGGGSKPDNAVNNKKASSAPRGNDGKSITSAAPPPVPTSGTRTASPLSVSGRPAGAGGAGNSNNSGNSNFDSGKRAIISPGQGIKVVRGAKISK